MKIISGELELDLIHNKYLESQFLALNGILGSIRIKMVFAEAYLIYSY